MKGTKLSIDSLPLFKQAKRLIAEAKDIPWQQVDQHDNQYTKFKYQLVVPYESQYLHGQKGHRLDSAVSLILQALHRIAPDGGSARAAYGKKFGLPPTRGSLILYTNEHKEFPFNELDQSLDKLRRQIGADWKMENGTLVRDMDPNGRDYWVVGEFVKETLGSTWKKPVISQSTNGTHHTNGSANGTNNDAFSHVRITFTDPRDITDFGNDVGCNFLGEEQGR